MWQAVWQHEWMLVCRNKSIVFGVGLLVLVGVYAIDYGHSFVSRQRQVIHSIDTTQAGRRSRIFQAYEKVDTLTKGGKQTYEYAHEAYLSDWLTQKTVYNSPTAFAALSIGQKDNYAYYYNLWILNTVHENRLQEIQNPDKVLAGNLDLAFILVYLFPLFIIALGYNVLSAEKENHTYALLKLYAPSIKSVVGHQLGFRFVGISVLVLLLSGWGFAFNGISLLHQSQDIAGWLILSLGYVGCWFALVYGVISFGQSSTFNAVALISTWIGLLFLIPSVLNYGINSKIDDSEKVKITNASREESYQLWNVPKGVMIDSFYRVAPQFGPTFYPIKDSSNTQFVAYMELFHRNMNAAGEASEQQQQQAYVRTLDYNLINPVYTALHGFNQIARTEINHQLHYRQAVQAYQQARRYFIFDFMLSKKPFAKRDYLQFPEFKYTPAQPSFVKMAGYGWPFLVWIATLMLVGHWNLRQEN